MSRILFAWEMGANYGHLVVSLRIARKLRERHHAVAFAVRDTRAAAELLAPERFPFVQAPTLGRRARLSKPPANFSEILLGEGYADPMGLLGAVQAWRSLIQLSQPSIILTDYAPTATVAAHSLQKPYAVLSNGFGAPPPVSPLPSIRPWEEIPAQHLIHADKTVNAAINAVLDAVGAHNTTTVAELYRQPLLCIFPELDPYGPRDGESYIGPIFALPGARRADWPTTGKRKILAYLRPDIPGFPVLTEALSAIDADKLCIVPGLSQEQTRRLHTRSMQISTSPLALDELLPQADLFVHYGGSGVLCQGLLAGVPALIVPGFVEQNLNARCAEAIGAALAMGPGRKREDFDKALAALLADESYRAHALTFARAHTGYSPELAIDRAVQAIEDRIALASPAEALQSKSSSASSIAGDGRD